METLQIILTISLIILCLSFTSVLIYLIFVLKDLRETIEEARDILKTGRKAASSVVMPLSTIMGVVGGISRGIKAVRSITDVFEEKKYKEEDDYEDY